MPVHVIPDEGERVRPNEISEKSSEPTYLKKNADADTSVYDKVLNTLKKLNILYSTNIQIMHDPVIEGHYKVTGDTIVIPIMEHKYDEIHWACSTSISIDAEETETLKEVMTSPNGH